MSEVKKPIITGNETLKKPEGPTTAEIKKIQGDVIAAFKTIVEQFKSGDYPGVVNASHAVAEKMSYTGQPTGQMTETFRITFPNTDYGPDSAILNIGQSTRTEFTGKNGRPKFVPVIRVEFTRTTEKKSVFEDDRYPSGSKEPGTRTSRMVFEIDNPTGFSQVVQKIMRKDLGPRLVTADLTLRGTATIYADSNTPKYGGKSLGSVEEMQGELAKLIEDAKKQPAKVEA